MPAQRIIGNYSRWKYLCTLQQGSPRLWCIVFVRYHCIPLWHRNPRRGCMRRLCRHLRWMCGAWDGGVGWRVVRFQPRIIVVVLKEKVLGRRDERTYPKGWPESGNEVIEPRDTFDDRFLFLLEEVLTYQCGSGQFFDQTFHMWRWDLKVIQKDLSTSEY